MKGEQSQVDTGERVSEITLGGRFRGLRILKRAQGLTTYHGRDLQGGGAIILKVASAEDFGLTARVRLEYEVALLNQREAYPDGGAIHLGLEDGVLFCARPYVAGVSLESRLQRGPLGANETTRLGGAVLAALAQIHPHGVLHRSIKPSNVILPNERPERAQLVDFELARSPRTGDTLGSSVHAAQYLSPEQSGLIDAPVDARSDLYAVGILLYECLTGRPPFAGRSVGEVLRQHLTARPAPLSARAADTPRGLELVIERVLRKDPRDRYQTARGMLTDLEQLLAALEGGDGELKLVVGAGDERSAVTEPAFIGRSDELGVLEAVVARARAGQGGLVLIEGESGRGKTWLLSELERRTTSLGTRVLHGHGLDRVAKRPYHVLAEVVGELISRVQLEPAWGAAIAGRLGTHGAAACASLPELRALLADQETASLGPAEYGEMRSMAALAALLDAIGTPEEPAVILIDDGQWADESTLRLLDSWQDLPTPEHGRHVVIALAFRPEEVADEHPLRSTSPLHHLRLSEFGAAEVREQVASMAGQLPEAAIQAVLQRAGGNPFLVSATVHGMVEMGALTIAASGWQVDPQKLANLQAAEHAAQILTLRLTRLSPPQRRLLSIAALLGRTFDPVLAGLLAGMDSHESMQIAEANRGSLIWAGGSGTAFTFVHDKIREALLDELSGEERRDLHRRAADHIEAAQPRRVFELAYHLDAAEDPVRALPFALDAAEQAHSRFALELAEYYYDIAARGAAAADPATRFLIHRGLGDVLTLRNRYPEAEDHYRRALELGASNRDKADVEKRWSQLEMKRGDMRAACDHAENALRTLGYRVPKSLLFLNAWTLWELGIQVLHTHFPRRFIRARRGPPDEDELFAIDIYHGLNGPYFFSRGLAWAGWGHLRLINLAERHPGTRAQGRAYAAHVTALAGFPSLYPRGIRIAKAGADLCEELGDLWGQAQALTFYGAIFYLSGRFDEGIEFGRKGSALFDRTGDRWEATHGLDFAVYGLVRKGDLAGAVRQAQDIWQRGITIGDSHALAWALDAWARATDGDVPAEMIALARSRSHDLQTTLAVSQAEGVYLIARGRLDEAVAVLEEARRRTMEEAGYFFDFNTHVLTYLLTALRMQAEQAPAWNPEERRRILARARVIAKQALSVTRKHRLSLAHTLRECAILAAMEGKPRRARKRIEESVEVAEELGEMYELAQSRLVRAELGRALGWGTGEGELAAARQEVAAFRAEARSVKPPAEPAEAGPRDRSLSLADRFATVLESGRAIATALNREAIYAKTRQAALLLLRSEHCVVLEHRSVAAAEGRPAAAPEGDGAGAGFIPVHGDVGVAVSEAVIRQACEQGRAVALTAAQALEDLSSRRAGARSVLCVPIRVRGEQQACLYLTHGDVSDLFGSDEQQIADFLATLAGAALENAEGFSRLQSFSRELESRVEDRTGQLAQANQELQESLRQVHETQEQLVQASKMAALGTLVAGLSHELNNPLSVVLGYCDVLLRQIPESTAARRSIVAIERQARRCRGLVKALLDFSRREPAARAPTSPAALSATVFELLAAAARDRDVEVRHDTQRDGLPDIIVSPQEVESALLNLLANAIDATPQGGSVELAVRAAERDGVPGVRFSVTDTGPGIPRDILPRIFDPFFTTKPVGRGTGLGLSITHQIVTAHEGHIDVDTAEGEGTTISIWLPETGRRPRRETGDDRPRRAIPDPRSRP